MPRECLAVEMTGAISDLETLLAFAATCLVIELTPGPNMAYLAGCSGVGGTHGPLAPACHKAAEGSGPVLEAPCCEA